MFATRLAQFLVPALMAPALYGATAPSVLIDSLTQGATIPATGTITVSGWAIDNTTSTGTAIASVQIMLDGTLVGTAAYGTNRADVCVVYPGRPGCPNVGFTYQLNTMSLSGGTHTITVVATDTDSSPDSGSFSVTVTAVTALPVVYIDSLAPGSAIAGTLAISGWAIDNTTLVGTGIGSVQILVDGGLAGTATYGTNRADVCTAYPGRPGCPNVGFTYFLNAGALSPGAHTITAIATDTDSVPDAGSYSVSVRVAAATLPVVFIEAPATGATVTGTVAVSGWAIDNTTGIGTAISNVQVLVDGALVGTASYGSSRPDVCGAYPGRPGCPNVGYAYQLNTASLSSGTHTITVVATDTDSTPDAGSYSVTVRVPPAVLPAAHIDSPATGATVSGTVTVSGWAIDSTTSIGTAIGSVQVKVDGALVGTAAYGSSRPDVCVVYPGRAGCPNVGYTYQLNAASLSSGTHTITVVATDTDGTPDAGSSSVAVNVGGQSTTLTITGPSTCQAGQICNYSASGGLPPYSYSLVSGSVGSISSSGVYTAPAHVVPKQVINGCQGTPNNSVFNTRVDNLPVHPNNALWMSNVDVGLNSFTGVFRLSGSTVLSTDPSVPMVFFYSPNPPGGTNFIFQPFPDRVSESGAAWTPPSLLPGIDNHFLTTYRDTCQEQENYQYIQTGAYPFYPAANSASGVLYSLMSHQVPGWGVDAAGLPLSPLIVHQEELLSAAAGNIDAIRHAARLTLDTASIGATNFVWPAQASTSGNFCQGPPTSQGSYWSITGNGTAMVTAASGNGFKLWPAGTTVTIDGTNYTVVSVSTPDTNAAYAAAGFYLSMTMSSPISAGSHLMTTPGSNCPPYGTRFRLKSSFNLSRYLPNCDVACQNVVQAIVRQQQRYGVILADAGSSWGFDSDGGITSFSIAMAGRQLGCDAAQCGFDGLLGNASNYEIVDESSFKTSQIQGASDNTWMEAKLGNPYVTPDDAVVVQVTDATPATAYYSVALQGVAIGVPHPNEVVMAGASPFQITPWITGTTNKSFTCTLSPSGGANGTITNNCLYSPPPTGAVSTLTNTTVTITASADSSVTKSVIIQIVPVSSDGKLHISLGKLYTTLYFSPTYTDTTGIVWWNDMMQGLPINLFPDGVSTDGPPFVTFSNYPGTDAYATSAPYIYAHWLSGYNDHHFRIHIPNGPVTGTVLPANGGAPAPNIAGFSFDCNGAPIVGQTDVFSFTGGLYVGRPLTCSQTVSDGVLHMVVRLQGVDLGNHGCGIPCYQATNLGVGNLVAGLVVTSASAQVSPARPSSVADLAGPPSH